MPHTDFIFSSYAEEHGFVGVVVALVLYFLLIMQECRTRRRLRTGQGCISAWESRLISLFHVLVTVGMVVGRMPVTGIPLPLMSSGGSNTWSVFLMLGLVNSVRTKKICTLRPAVETAG